MTQTTLRHQWVPLTLSKKILKLHNVTDDQLKRSWIEIDSKGEQYLVIEETRYPLEVRVNLLMLNGANNSMALNFNRYNRQTMKDIEDDPTLTPDVLSNVNWTSSKKCDIKSISINVTKDFVSLNIATLAKCEKDSTPLLSSTPHDGLILAVINPFNCKASFRFAVNSSDVTGFRDTIWAVDSISPGRLVHIGSVKGGAPIQNNQTLEKFHEAGSQYAPFYFPEASWVSVFIKGGKWLLEAFAPNLSRTNSTGSVLQVHFDLYRNQLDNMYSCPSWPWSARWKARKIFCEIHDGFSRLCDCENPLEFPENHKLSGNNETNSFIPIIIMARTRTRHFLHLLESLNVQEEVTKEKILVITDGHVDDVTRIIFILDLKMLVHRSEGKGTVTRVSRNLRFALYNALNVFPSARAFIILEDDLLVSPDFYSYMAQLEPIFAMDKSVFCISAYNHYSYPHTSHDPRLTYRVRTFPAYGWMMSREIIEEVLPKWLPITFVIEWDYFLRLNIILRDRECIIPDINRSYHWSTGGAHFSPITSEIYHLRRTLNKITNVTLGSLERLREDNYEKEFRGLLKASKAMQFLNRENFDSQITENQTYSIFVWHGNHSEESLLYFALEMDLWIYDIRDSHNLAWRITYKNSTLIVVGVPQSPYSVYMPEGYKVLNVSNVITKPDIDLQANIKFLGSLSLPTQKPANNLPSF